MNEIPHDPPRYWRSLAAREGMIQDPPPPGVSRRSFLETAGFTASLLAIGGCHRAPTVEALPFAEQPTGTRAGQARRYASTCGGCAAGCGLLVTVRDGRPLKMEGLPDHPLSAGGLCAAGQAAPLGLFDSQRLTAPLKQGEPSTWEQVDAEIIAALDQIKSVAGAVRVVTSSNSSPTLRATIAKFLADFEDAQHVCVDNVSVSAILDAYETTHSRRILPNYRFGQAHTIVSLDADFLGTWISPVEFTAGWAKGRCLPAVRAVADHDTEQAHDAQPDVADAHMNYVVQFEARMTLTGSNADKRYRVHPQALRTIAQRLLEAVAKLAGTAVEASPPGDAGVDQGVIDTIALRLWSHRGQSLVVSGSQDVETQILVSLLNRLLENEGHTVQLDRHSQQRQDDDAQIDQLVKDLQAGRIAALFAADLDLLHQLPVIANELARVDLTVSLSQHLDETAANCKYVCPDQHALESWLDASPVRGIYSLRQPTLQPLGESRGALESFSVWSGRRLSAIELVQEHWRAEVLPKLTSDMPFERFWHDALQTGFVTFEPEAFGGVGQPQIQELLAHASQTPPERPTDRLTLLLHADSRLPNTRHAHNPWLQELPDPVTKLTWDNCVAVSPKLAREYDLQDGDVIKVEFESVSLELPVYIQPGQHDQVLAIALGYGVRGTERFADVGPRWIQRRQTVGANGLVGINAASLVGLVDGMLTYDRHGVTFTKTRRKHSLATTQLHDHIEVPVATRPPGSDDRRALVQETTLVDFRANPSAGAPHSHHFAGQLWPTDHPSSGHRWGMVIDLNRCTGCSACLVACQSENNVPVVGRDEVRRHREMHWIRIDRYYSGDVSEPDVIHQPMMCQHCGNAPCETVCPVLATVHSGEGLNQQVYNRCVGTRYCANNCPYKVRRFNWFDYAHDDTLQNLALNPDVTVRMRGIMEKCSMCVQRIQEGKIASNARNTALEDGTIRTACQQSCPSQAILFGDLNDPESRVGQAMHDARHFVVLEELNVQPNVGYLRKVRNNT